MMAPFPSLFHLSSQPPSPSNTIAAIPHNLSPPSHFRSQIISSSPLLHLLPLESPLILPSSTSSQSLVERCLHRRSIASSFGGVSPSAPYSAAGNCQISRWTPPSELPAVSSNPSGECFFTCLPSSLVSSECPHLLLLPDD